MTAKNGDRTPTPRSRDATEALVGDIGGTKCLLAVQDDAGRLGEPRRYDSHGFADFAAVVRAFLADAGIAAPARACFAVAGPVAGDRGKTTNLPWVIDGRELEAGFGFARARVINDFHAQALAVLALGDGERALLHAGNPVAGGPIAVLGAGTGLGEAFLYHADGRYQVIPSEGGHSDFAPVGELQIDLLRWLTARLGGRVSYERILSGAGLANLYQFLRDRDPAAESAAVRDAMAHDDPAAVVTRFCGEDALCDAAVQTFCAVYGQEAGNLALKVLASGGVFVTGGIAPRILPRLRDGRFERGYGEKGRLAPLVAAIPVHVVTAPYAGLLGAGVAAAQER